MSSALVQSLVGSRRRAALVVLFWLVVVALVPRLAPAIDAVEDNSSANQPPATSQSAQARDLVRSQFPGQDAVPAIVVVRAADSAASQSVAAGIADALEGTGRPAQVSAVIAPGAPGADALVSADGRTRLVVVALQGNPSDESFQHAVDQVRDLAAQQADGTQVAVTGPAGIATDTVKVFSSGDKVLLLGTVLLVLVILLAIYRAPLLALVPLLAAGIAMRLTEGLGAAMADAGWFAVSSQTASIMTVLLFGVGTDYALVITARYREALHEQALRGNDTTPAARCEAMAVALRAVGESVLSSAATVVLAMLALLVCVSPSLRGFGPYLALGVAVMAVVAFTLIPALLLLLGRAVFWPGGQDKAARRAVASPLWHRVATGVVRRPRRVVAGSLAALAVMSAGLVGYTESFDFVSGFRVDTQSARGQDLVRDGFGPGEVAPATVLVTSSADLRSDPALEQVAQGLRSAPGVARVGAAARLSTDGHTAAFTVVLDTNPYSAKALDAVPQLRAAALQAARDAGVAAPSVLVGGESAQTADTRTALDRDLRAIVPLVLLVVALVLGLLLRSVLAPVYLVASLVVSFAATMGATTFVTVTVLGDDGIGNRVTAYVFVFLVALGVDYTIFVMSRLRQEAAHLPPKEALTRAVSRTGGVVSSAGLILAATFSVLTTQPIRELFQFGFAMAFGILLDTFVVRPLLVPAVVRLLGRQALWPYRMSVADTPAQTPSPLTARRTA